MDFQQLHLGLGDEFAMRKSLDFCFRSAALLACTQHLKQNTEHCARESAGLSASQRNHFVYTIFGDAGLTSCSDVTSFDSATDRFRSGLLDDASDPLRDYFNNRYSIMACRATSMPSVCQCLPVCLSVTLVDCDHRYPKSGNKLGLYVNMFVV